MADGFSSSTSIPMTDLSKNLHEQNVLDNKPPHHQSLLNTANTRSIPTSINPSTSLMTSVAEIPTYRRWSIFNICCCCFCIGLIALHFSSKTSTFKAAHNVGAALNASRKAHRINLVATILGAILMLLYLFSHMYSFGSSFPSYSRSFSSFS